MRCVAGAPFAVRFDVCVFARMQKSLLRGFLDL